MTLPPLSPWEMIIYDELYNAAENSRPCPNYLDLNECIGAESSSTSPKIVRRLEDKGLIIVKRYQRFREVQIVATGKWTARHPAMQTDRPHVPRGMRSSAPPPSDRKHYRNRLAGKGMN